MPNPLSSHNTTEIAKTRAREHWLIEMGFSTPLRISSRETVTGPHDSNSYKGVGGFDMTIATDGKSAKFSWYDEDQTDTPTFQAQTGAGTTIVVKIWQLYGDSPWTSGEEDLRHQGVVGPWSRSGSGALSVSSVEPETKFLPDIVINEQNGFNWLPPADFRAETKNGIIRFDRLRRVT